MYRFPDPGQEAQVAQLVDARLHDQDCDQRAPEVPGAEVGAASESPPGTPPGVKGTNPKDAIGCRKVPFSTVPAQVVAEIGLALLEGAAKYGRHNYRIAGVRASIYYDACQRHITSWWEGQDLDPYSGLSHVTKALACLTVLRDAMIQERLSDDRPPRVRDTNWVLELNRQTEEILAQFPDPKPPYTQEGQE